MDQNNIKPITVHISDFQSIADLEFEINGFTCITGPTNIGKSAIVRAISSSILNTPVVGHVRKGSKFCTVALKSNDWGFKWEKGDKGANVNRCWIDGKEDPLDKIGSSQLEHVAKMGFQFIEIGDKKIFPWLASQWNPLFLLNESGPSITEFISGISNLNLLQDATVLASKTKRKASDELKSQSEEISKLRGKIEKLGDLSSILKIISELDQQSESIKKYEEKIQIGESHCSRINSQIKVIDKIDKSSGINIPVISDLSKKTSCLRSMATHFENCKKLADRIVKTKEIGKIKIRSTSLDAEIQEMKLMYEMSILSKSERILSSITNVKLPKLETIQDWVSSFRSMVKHDSYIHLTQLSINKISEEIKNVPSLYEYGLPMIKNGTKHVLNLKKFSSEIMDLKSKLSKTQESLDSVQSEINQIPNCPSCGRPSLDQTHSHVDHDMSIANGINLDL